MAWLEGRAHRELERISLGRAQVVVEHPDARRVIGEDQPERHPGVAARWAEGIFCTPPRNSLRAGEDAFLAAGTRRTVRWENQDLAVWEWGDGPVIVLVHGWGSRTGRFGALAEALVAGGFRVVGFDAPAHGDSKGDQASLPQFSRALRRVADDIGPVHGLIGHSLGGAAVSLAMHDGLRSTRAVLLSPPADVGIFSDAFVNHLRIPARANQRMRRNLESRLRFRFEELHIPTLARGMTARALIFHDRDDPDVPHAHGEEIAQAWPGAELVSTSGLGHRAIVRDPDVIRRTVAFLSDGDA